MMELDNIVEGQPVLDSSWTTWRERKMDEVLATQFAGRIAEGDPPGRWPGIPEPVEGEKKRKKGKRGNQKTNAHLRSSPANSNR